MPDNNWSFARPDGSFLATGQGGSTRSVTGATMTVNRSMVGQTIMLNRAAGIIVSLPKASGSGDMYRFVVGTTFTGAGEIRSGNNVDVMRGSANILDNDLNAQTAYAATGTDDSLIMNGTTMGGLVGDWAEVIDVAAGTWAVRAQLVVPAGSNPIDCFAARV